MWMWRFLACGDGTRSGLIALLLLAAVHCGRYVYDAKRVLDVIVSLKYFWGGVVVVGIS